jgi:hypothetical protein
VSDAPAGRPRALATKSRNKFVEFWTMLKLFIPNLEEELMDHDRNKTAATMRAEMDDCLAKIGSMTFLTEGVIDDYPIGRKLRGKCKLSAEYKKGKGFRTVRQTTDKNDKWYKPKTSRYCDHPISVVSYGGKLGWLNIGGNAVYLTWANGDQQTLALANLYSAPRLQDHTYQTVSYEPISMADILDGKNPPVRETKTHTLPADPPEVIACWDAWLDGRRKAILLVEEKLKQLRASLESGEVA